MIHLAGPVVLAAALAGAGVYGLLARRNAVLELMGVELMLNAVNINLVTLSRYFNNMQGQVFAIFIMVVAVAEAAVGLGILIAMFRNRGTVLADEINLLKW